MESQTNPASSVPQLIQQLKDAQIRIDELEEWNDYWRKLANDAVLKLKEQGK